MSRLDVLTRSEITAISIACDELQSYIETVGDEGALDDEEMPTEKLRWAVKKLRALLAENAEVSHPGSDA